MLPRLTCLLRLLKIADDGYFIGCVDEEPFVVIGAAAQLPCFAGALRGEGGFADVSVHPSQHGVGHRKLRIDFAGAFEQGDCRGTPVGRQGLPCHAIRLQCLKRRGGRLSQGNIQFANHCQRFAGPGSKSTGDLAEGTEDIFFSCCLYLFLVDYGPGPAVPGAHP